MAAGWSWIKHRSPIHLQLVLVNLTCHPRCPARHSLSTAAQSEGLLQSEGVVHHTGTIVPRARATMPAEAPRIPLLKRRRLDRQGLCKLAIPRSSPDRPARQARQYPLSDQRTNSLPISFAYSRAVQLMTGRYWRRDQDTEGGDGAGNARPLQ